MNLTSDQFCMYIYVIATFINIMNLNEMECYGAVSYSLAAAD